MADSDSPLGIIAGSGRLPQLIIEACRSRNRKVFVVGINGHADPAVVDQVPHLWARMGEAGKILRRLKQEGVNELIMAGGVRRPSLRELRPDRYAARFYFNIGRQALGDDGLLKGVAKVLEKEGFTIVGIDKLIADILAPEGDISRLVPLADERADINHGMKILRAIGPLDIGQAVVVQHGIVLGVEAAEGTNVLIERTATLTRAGGKPVLIKISKPKQDRRFDLPTIGAETLRNVASAGFAGIAVEGGRTILLDAPLLPGLADDLGIFLTGVV